jgi:hypothetical protein
VLVRSRAFPQTVVISAVTLGKVRWNDVLQVRKCSMIFPRQIGKLRR